MHFGKLIKWAAGLFIRKRGQQRERARAVAVVRGHGAIWPAGFWHAHDSPVHVK